jgi:F0F1-type ATP synthase assembly protein I
LPSSPGSRSPLSVGLEWSTRLTTIGFVMVLPVLIGYWIDRKLGSKPWGLLVGSGLGFTTALLQLLQLTRRPPPDPMADDPASSPPSHG